MQPDSPNSSPTSSQPEKPWIAPQLDIIDVEETASGTSFFNYSEANYYGPSGGT